MNNKNKFKQVDIKIFIIFFIIFTLVFYILSYITIKSIKTYYFNHMKENTVNLAKSYSQSLSKATQAYEVVNELLEEKLLVASRTTALYDGRFSNELLEELANKLEVDEIYSYNQEGEIVFSNTGEFIGWKVYEGHPVYDYMNSNNISLVEEITQDTEKKIYYKYGYFKTSDGGFVQIGVLADKIQNFLGRFEMQRSLEEMNEVGVASLISYIDNELKIMGSTDIERIGQEITNIEVKAGILENKEYGILSENHGEKEYEVFVPVYFGETKIGILAIQQSIKETEAVIRQASIIGIVTVIILYAALLYTMLFIHKKNRRLIQLAYYDTLTGLPNKQYLKMILTEEIEKKEENSKALLLINCSNFKIVNLTYGYEYGDELLKEMSRKIQKIVNDNNLLFRFSADRFVLYVKNHHDRNELIRLTNTISEVFNTPFKVKDAEQNLGVQIGIVEINSKYHNVDRLLKGASISLGYIKNNDTINYAFFNEEMERKLQREELIEKELRIAIFKNDTKRLYLEFQPQVDLKTNSITCFEALARMRTESLGFVSPLEFISVAERKQLMVPLGNMILKTACEFIRTLKDEGYEDIKVAVNISGIQLLRDDFTDTVMDIIKATNIEKSNLELEITESILLGNYEIINEKLKTLRENKIAIALDDFGTGYSSFSRITELNIDTLKIDRYFISKIPTKERKELITGDIISMSHKLGLTVVTEGVEVEEQKKYLIENGCDIMQGYLFSKSLIEKDAIELLKTNKMTK